MLIAQLGEDRISPTRGVEAKCPGCGAPVVAKMGPLKIHHWAHAPGTFCEFEREGMTEWHLWWQRQFSEEFREVVIGGHRADICVDGQVVEFQHSSIPLADLESRNKTYKRPIWIFSLSGIAKNLHIQSRNYSRVGDVWERHEHLIVNHRRRHISGVAHYPSRANVILQNTNAITCFHMPGEDRVWWQLREPDSFSKREPLARLTVNEFVAAVHDGNFFGTPLETPKPVRGRVRTDRPCPEGPAVGEIFTWRRREVCFLSLDEMYFADTEEGTPLKPEQCLMALQWYMAGDVPNPNALPEFLPTGRRRHPQGRHLTVTKADRMKNRLAYSEEVRRWRREVRLGEVL